MKEIKKIHNLRTNHLVDLSISEDCYEMEIELHNSLLRLLSTPSHFKKELNEDIVNKIMYILSRNLIVPKLYEKKYTLFETIYRLLQNPSESFCKLEDILKNEVKKINKKKHIAMLYAHGGSREWGGWTFEEKGEEGHTHNVPVQSWIDEKSKNGQQYGLLVIHACNEQGSIPRFKGTPILYITGLVGILGEYSTWLLSEKPNEWYRRLHKLWRLMHLEGYENCRERYDRWMIELNKRKDG